MDRQHTGVGPIPYRMKETRCGHLQESVELVRNVGGNVLGVTLNAMEDVSGSEYSYYYRAETRPRGRRGRAA